MQLLPLLTPVPLKEPPVGNPVKGIEAPFTHAFVGIEKETAGFGFTTTTIESEETQPSLLIPIT